MLRERRLGLTAGAGKGYPELQAPEPSRVLSGRLLGVRDPSARRHEVEHTRAGRPFQTEAVLVEQLPV